jgi:hypothetical protein
MASSATRAVRSLVSSTTGARGESDAMLSSSRPVLSHAPSASASGKRVRMVRATRSMKGARGAIVGGDGDDGMEE